MTPLPTILLIEDNDDDVFLMRRALTKAGIDFPLQVVVDGQQALDYFAGSGPYADRSRYPAPTLVFLDLKLPYVHGFDVLVWLRSQAEWKDLCVVILTSSAEQRDRERALELSAKAFLVKPSTVQMVSDALQFLHECAPGGIAA
jgi:CheY-like chemotaxis protein